MKIEHLPIGKVKNNPINPRLIKDDAFRRLVKSLEDCPDLFEARPLLCSNRTGELIVLGGNMRLRAAQELKYKQVPVIVLSGLTERQEREIAIKDNGAFGEWDFDALSAWDDLPLADWGIDLPEDWLSPEPTQGLTDPDEVPEVPEDPITKPGDLYLLGKHRLLCGDSLIMTEVNRLMNGKKADMVFCDPPYGVSYADKNAMLNAISPGNRIQTEIKNDHRTVEEMRQFWTDLFTSLHTASTDRASYYFTGPQGGELMMIMMMSIIDAGWQLKHMIIWVKNNHVLGRCDYHYKHEPILYGWKEKGTHEFFGGSSEFSVWEIDKPLKSELHPTMKPVELVERTIRNSTKKGNLVIDYCLGSGSTIIAAEQLNRICYGMEIDPHYCDVIVKRWEDFTGQKATLEK